MKIKQYIPTEQEEQELLVEWLEYKKIKFSALPLNTYTEHWSVKNRNKRIGVRSGVPDIMIILPTNKLVFIEMKRTSKSVLSENQKEWIKALNNCCGV